MTPSQADMVTEVCPDRPRDEDILCVRCGWEGHATLPDAPWPVFMQHVCMTPADLFPSRSPGPVS